MSSKISALSAASAYDGTEAFPVVQGGSTKKGLISAIATYLAGISAWLPFSKLTGTIAVTQLGAAAGYVPAWAITASGVNFNSANTDTTIPIVLPTGFTRYLVSACRIFGASGTLTTATFGLFTQTGAGGTALVTSGTACLISTASEGTPNNSQVATVQNTGAQSYAIASQPNLYFRVQTAQGSAATANVMITVVPLA